jgi:hypothetical protein
MRRRLLQYGAFLRDLLDGAQREAAASLLATDKLLEDIAAEVNYSECSGASRSRWRCQAVLRALHRKPSSFSKIALKTCR